MIVRNPVVFYMLKEAGIATVWATNDRSGNQDVVQDSSNYLYDIPGTVIIAGMLNEEYSPVIGSVQNDAECMDVAGYFFGEDNGSLSIDDVPCQILEWSLSVTDSPQIAAYNTGKYAVLGDYLIYTGGSSL